MGNPTNDSDQTAASSSSQSIPPPPPTVRSLLAVPSPRHRLHQAPVTRLEPLRSSEAEISGDAGERGGGHRGRGTAAGLDEAGAYGVGVGIGVGAGSSYDGAVPDAARRVSVAGGGAESEAGRGRAAAQGREMREDGLAGRRVDGGESGREGGRDGGSEEDPISTFGRDGTVHRREGGSPDFEERRDEVTRGAGDVVEVASAFVGVPKRSHRRTRQKRLARKRRRRSQRARAARGKSPAGTGGGGRALGKGWRWRYHSCEVVKTIEGRLQL